MSGLDPIVAIEMIRETARRLDKSAAELSRLDAVAGDGDHGVNMAAAFGHAAEDLGTEPPHSAADVFTAVGHSFGTWASGSSGALFGAFFQALGGRLRQSDAQEAADFVDGLQLAAKRVALVGQTAPGSKTMLDALAPAVDAARDALVAGDELAALLTASAAASARGATATADMRARAGRARHAPNGAIGTKDPGAVTVSIMFAAWAAAASGSASS